MKKKIFLVKDESFKIPPKIYSYLKNNFEICSKVEESQIIIVFGGDGVMLRAIRDYHQYRIPFFGLNFGHVGFLMNKPKINKISELLSEDIEKAKVKLLKAKIYDSNGSLVDVIYAFNDLYMERSTIATAKIRISIDGKVKNDPLVCDGAVISTSAGSTAYSASAGGIILSLGKDRIVLTGISPAIFHNWRTIQLPNNSQVEIEAIELEKRPIRFLRDGMQIDNVVKAQITSSDRYASLVFAKSEKYKKKVAALQFKHFWRGLNDACTFIWWRFKSAWHSSFKNG